MLRLQPEEQSRSRHSEPKVFRCNGFISEEGTQADVFEHVAPVVDRVMEGYNGVVFCYGITGSGKTHTMSGPPKEPLAKQVKDPAPPEVIAAQQGIVQRAAKRIFEFIRDRSALGEIFTVEASFLEIYSPDGVRENLIDLLASKADEAKLEVKQDALVGHKAFMCEGLKSVPIRSPDEMRQVLEGGRRRCTYMETSRNCVSSRSHCLFTVVIESTSSSSIRDTDPDVRRGKLVLVDLAGSESLKKVMAVQEANEELRRKQAIGINKVLTHLGAVVNNLNAGYENSTGFRNSALTMLLRDCLGGGARALLVANIGPEADWSSETAMTLRFAQKMMKVKNVEQKVVIDASQSNLVQMRKRHQACLARLQQHAAEEAEQDLEERAALDKEIEELNQRLLTKESASDILEKMQQEQTRKMEEFRTHVTENMAKQFADIQEESQQQIAGLKEVIEAKAKEGVKLLEQQHSESREARCSVLEAEIQSTELVCRAAQEEAAELRVRLAAAQQKADTLQELQSDLAKQRSDSEAEKLQLKQQAEEQGQRLAQLEREMDRFRVEADVRKEEKLRLEAERAADTTAADQERRAWQEREAELQATIAALRTEQELEEKSLQDLGHKDQDCREEIIALERRAEELEVSVEKVQKDMQLVEDQKAYLDLDIQSFRDAQANLQAETVSQVDELEAKLKASKKHQKDLEEMLNETYAFLAADSKRRSRRQSKVSR